MRTSTRCTPVVGKSRTRWWANSVKICLTLFLSLFLISENTQAQLVGGAAVKANFGVDADYYANTLLFNPANVPAMGTDDWFVNTTRWPGSGTGIIDATNGSEIRDAILANMNYAFTRRMSTDQNTTVGNYRWIDAVYGRDNNAIGNFLDSSIFSGNSNKNGDNPTTWSLGIGSIPQKNDIVDVMGHLRRDLTTDSLWAFGGATTISSDGNSHTDFEFFRAPFAYTPGSSFVNTGPNAGHTAWQFDADGDVTIPGDVLLAVDFENGGTKPLAQVRIWMSQTDFNTLMSKPNRPFNLTGTFDQGNGSGVYGYAGIDAKAGGSTNIWAVVNTNADVLGSPWGSLEGNDFEDDVKKLQFAEFGINLTAMGLDVSSNAGGNPCVNILGTLIVKTRSSSSFTAELKDFAGPYIFGSVTDVQVSAGADKVLTCTNPTATLTATTPTPSATIVWTLPGGGTSTDNPLVVSVAGTYTVTASAGPQGCIAQDAVVVTEDKDAPNANAGGDVELTCTMPSANLLGTSTTEGASFEWTLPGGGTSSGAALNDVTVAGTYTLTVTGPNGCTAQDALEVTVDKDAPNANAGGDVEIPCGSNSTTLTGSSSTEGATFMWTRPDGTTSAGAVLNDVTAAGTYTLTVTGPNGCTATDETIVTVITDCGNVYGSYTQGYYGGNGKSCNDDEQVMKPWDLINDLIGNDPIIIGRTNDGVNGYRSVVIPVGSGMTVHKVMPGGGTPTWLTDVDNVTISTNGDFKDSYLTKKGKINNVFLSQTIALSLNVRLTSSDPSVAPLASFPIEYNNDPATEGPDDSWFQTLATTGCDQYMPVECSYQTFTIKHSVTNYLTKGGTQEATVADLLDLANDLLGGALIPGTDNGGYTVPSYADVNNAVDAINRGFDEWRQYVGSYNTNLSCDVTTTTARMAQPLTQANQVTVHAYPNPFTDVVKFSIESKVSGQAQLEVVNMIGQKVATVYNGYIKANHSQVVEFRATSIARTNLIYILKINGQQVSGKLLNAKE